MSEVAIRGRERADVASSLRGAEHGPGERAVSLAAGSLLLALGLRRRTLPGLLVASVGGALVARGASGEAGLGPLGRVAGRAVQSEPQRIEHSVLIQRPAEELYRAWRDLERLPHILTHLESVTVLDERRSRWAVPGVAGGHVEWDAEIVRDEPGVAIAWQSLPGAEVQNAGEVRFTEAPGHRGTQVHVSLGYRPPAGRLGDLVATLWGVSARRQVREDLRAFKRTMEAGEQLTVEGQPTGSCGGLGRLVQGGRSS